MIPVKAIVGLGNPGDRYAGTRHNIGFMVVDALARKSGKAEWFRGCRSLIRRLDSGGREILLVKPLTYMNLAGRAIIALLAEYPVSAEDLIVVFDDLNLPFGRIRIRSKGSAGGHRGLDSILEALGTDEIVRVRIGVGEENVPADKAEFVLSDFPPERAKELDELTLRAGSAASMIITDGVSKAMSVFNA